ncbi:TolB family protein [Kribbella sp. NPDC056951]|uniref:TolB family protein n=1 Tax=Kribbella sp. NPDC056951 TaxID=3345978 RepID=UPI003628712B
MVVLIVAALLAGAGVLAWRGLAPRTGQLVVEVSGLPPETAGRVTVEGAAGFRQAVTSSTTLKVAPGKYVVRVDPVDLPDAKTYPADELWSANVVAGGAATVRAAYKILIPDTTVVLDPEAPGLVSPSTGKQLSFEAATAGLKDVRAGHFVVIAEGPKTPELVVRKVLSVQKAAGRINLDTAPASLEQAVPRGVLRFEAADKLKPVSYQEAGVLAEIDTWKHRLGQCGISSPRISYKIRDFDLNFDGSDLEWSASPLNPYVKLTLKSRFGYQSTIGLEAGLGGHCSHDDEVKLVSLPKRFTKAIKIGKVKVNGTINLVFKAEVAATAAATAAWTQTVDFTAQAEARSGRGAGVDSDFSGWPPKFAFTGSPKVDGKLSGSLKMGFRLRFSSGDALNFIEVGPSYDLTDGVRFTITSEGEASIDQIYTAGVSHRYKLLGKRFGYRVFDLSWTNRVWTGKAERLKPPSGTAYYAAPGADGGQLALYAKSNAEPARVINPSVPYGVALSPDGKRLAWIDVASGTNVMISDVDGRHARQVATAPNRHGLCQLLAWSADSGHLLYPAANEQWAVVEVATGKQTAVLQGMGCYPVWAPDGQHIAWYDHGPGSTANIRITDASGTTVRFVPYVDGVADICFNTFAALAPGGNTILVDPAEPSRHACGDGPGRVPSAGVIADTRTGKVITTGVGQPLRSGVYLPDGRLAALTATSSELVLVGTHGQVLARQHDPTFSQGAILLRYLPN